MDKQINFKILVLGAQGVGKSSLIMRYLKGEFSESYNVTVGVEFASKLVQVEEGLQVRLQIWDTAGQEFFQALVRSFYKGISAVFLLYAIDKADSLLALKRWVEEVRENSHEEVVMFLIGSRLDRAHYRQVESSKAADFLKEISGALLVQTSAKTGENIELLFKKAAQHMYKKFKINKSYRDLVQPEHENNLSDTIMRATRGQSIVLRRETFAEGSRPPKKGNCCE